MVGNTAELMREFQKRAQACGLQVDCLGAGNFYADTAIVGEAPGDREVQLKQPFVGGSGQHLWNAVRKYGLTRQTTYYTNVVKRQLAQIETKKKDISKNELEHWTGLLEWELSCLPNLKHVLVLGNHALVALVGESGVTKWRGSVIQHDRPRPMTYVVTFNPAMVTREPKWEVVFAFDIGKLDRVIRGVFKGYPITELINPSCTEAITWIDKMHDEKIPLSVDIETIAQETACVGLTNDSHTGTCISFRDQRTNTYSMREELEIKLKLQRLFSDPSTKLVAQNGMFDSYWMWYKDRIQMPRVWFDTLLAHHTLYPSLPHNLGFLTAQYTDHPYYKDDKEAWKDGGDIDTFWRYNVKDCCITLKVSQMLQGELRAQKMEKFFFEHVMRIQPHLVGMTTLGIPVDEHLRDHIRDMISADVARSEREFHEAVHRATGDPLYSPNPRSPTQLRELFFNRLRLVGRGDSTDDDNRARMLRHPRTTEEAKAVLIAVNKYAEGNKFLGTYADMNVDPDHHIRCEYKQYGTQSAPGRLSSSSVMWGSGTNLQNQPVRSKPMFTAEDGCVMLYFDLAQAEARIVAEIWNVRGLQENFELARSTAGVDVHRANASRIFKQPYDAIPSFDFFELGKTTDNLALDGKPTLRYLGKRCVHGLNYRMGVQKLADVCNIPYPQAEEAWRAYHHAFPEIRQGWDTTLETVQRERQLFTPLGRRLIFLGRLPQRGAGDGTNDATALDSIIAFVPQSTIGDKVSLTIAECEEDNDWPKHDARIAMNIHDALIAMVRDDPDCIKQAARVMKKHAESPIYIRGKPTIIPADFAVSQRQGWRAIEVDGVTTHIEYFPSPDGLHRWSSLTKVKGLV